MLPFIDKFEECIGKTIKHADELQDMRVLVFTDGTYTAIKAESWDNWEDSGACVKLEELGRPNYFEGSNYENGGTEIASFVAMGLYTPEEVETWRIENERSKSLSLQATENEEFILFTQLKAKYEK